jgi:hypothetical protein
VWGARVRFHGKKEGPELCVARRTLNLGPSLNIQILNPLEYPAWDALLLTAERATIVHTAAWARVLRESYGYRPLYFSAVVDGRLAGLIPVMEIDSFITGKRGVSLPFTDICHPIADSRTTFDALVGRIKEYGNQVGWKCVDFKGGGSGFDGVPHYAEHFTHILDLGPDEAALRKAFRESTRRNIRHAEKAGVEVTLSHTREALEAFYELHCITRRHHGLPPQPWSFFAKIHEHIIARESGFVALGQHLGRTVAGAVYFQFRDRALYKYGASDRTYQNLRANNLVMWEAIRWLNCSGFRSLHFGRTEPENRGLLQFKNGWRAAEGKVAYYKLDLKRDAFCAETNGLKTSYSWCKILPLLLLKLAGSMLYRHVG